MFARYTEGARRAVVRAGMHSLDAGRATLDVDMLVLALAEVRPFSLPSFTASEADVRELVDLGNARALLATLGIDLDVVRRRTRAGADEPGLWRLRRSRVRPLRVTLYGPLGELPLAMHTRKVIEVAQWQPGAVTGERLLWGLLADTSNGAARLLREAGVDLDRLVDEAAIPRRRAA
ncbi:Clp protease N-terminal domain-containing protein [Nonomuraea jiangxiensis]|uniref:Clp amino terminal domain-containing protein, pathogenicity island component n=1 Tax=Nonomuraea jiangxiensis TaxID=633440 RepID=A0A1G9S4I8_9ACTN|nr:Clp protease N-terminal domain-containing protein [Nonomuraea jiangxiensis]SDM30312.1 Clp amino terminal domain-containing protein, pathogenicity island component [Nonomuraea jiangxiensis]